MPKKEIVFLSRRYVVDAAANWFGYAISFNTADDITTEYKSYCNLFKIWPSDSTFEEFLQDWIEDNKRTLTKI